MKDTSITTRCKEWYGTTRVLACRFEFFRVPVLHTEPPERFWALFGHIVQQDGHLKPIDKATTDWSVSTEMVLEQKAV